MVRLPAIQTQPIAFICVPCFGRFEWHCKMCLKKKCLYVCIFFIVFYFNHHFRNSGQSCYQFPGEKLANTGFGDQGLLCSPFIDTHRKCSVINDLL